MIRLKAEERGFLVIDVYLDDKSVEDDVLFFKVIFDAIMTQGAEKGMYGGHGSIIYKAFRKLIDDLDFEVSIPLLFGTIYVARKQGKKPTISQAVLKNDLKELFKEAQRKGISSIVLFFDDCDILAKNETLLRTLKIAFSNVKGYNLIFGGTKKLTSIMRIFIPMTKIELEDFKNVEEIKKCVLNPLDAKEKKLIDSKCFEELLRLTHGSPRLVKLFAHYMYREYMESNTQTITITDNMLLRVSSQLETQCVDPERYEWVRTLIASNLYSATPGIVSDVTGEEVGANGVS